MFLDSMQVWSDIFINNNKIDLQMGCFKYFILYAAWNIHF